MTSAPHQLVLRRIVLLSAAALAMILAPAAVLAQGPPAVHEVMIFVNDDGSLSYSQDPVYAYPGDMVVFSAPGSSSWSVTFTGETPFANRQIGGPGDQSRRVPVLPTAAAGSYFYVASVQMGDITYEEDPEIIVRGRGEELPSEAPRSH